MSNWPDPYQITAINDPPAEETRPTFVKRTMIDLSEFDVYAVRGKRFPRVKITHRACRRGQTFTIQNLEKTTRWAVDHRCPLEEGEHDGRPG